MYIYMYIRRAIGPGRDRVFLVFVLACYRPLSPQGAPAPAIVRLGLARSCRIRSRTPSIIVFAYVPF